MEELEEDLVFHTLAKTCLVDFQALVILEVEIENFIHLGVGFHSKEPMTYLNNFSEVKIHLLIFLMMIIL